MPSKKAKKKPTVLNLQRDKRKLQKANTELREALARACDLAIDAADVILEEEVILDPESGEDEDFRAEIAELRALSKHPEAERHIERRKARKAVVATEGASP